MTQRSFKDSTGAKGYLFHWGWLLFFAGIPFLGWSALGLLLILIHWAVARPNLSAPLPKNSASPAAPNLYRVAVLGLLGAYGLSLIPAESMIDALGAVIGFGLLLLFGINYACRLEMLRPGWWRRYIVVVPFTGLANALIGIYQYSKTPIRVLGLHGNPNAYSTALLISLYLGVAALSLYRDGRRWLIAPYAVIVTAALMATGSRGAWVGAVAGMGVFMILLIAQHWRVHRGRALLIGVGGVLTGVLMLYGVFTSASPSVQARMSSVLSIDANMDRVTLYGTMVRMIKANPLFGVGMGNIKVRFAEFLGAEGGEVHGIAHNYFLQSLGETGIVGTAFLILLWVVWFTRGWPAQGSPPATLLLYSLLVGLLVRDQFDGSLSIFYVAFLLNWLGGTVVGSRVSAQERLRMNKGVTAVGSMNSGM